MSSILDIWTVPQVLTTAAQMNPDREAIYDRTRRLTYRELEEESEHLANILAEQGIQKGDRVGICLPNWHETIIVLFAVTKVGGIIVPFNPKNRLYEIQQIIQDCGPKLCFVSEEFELQVGLEAIVSSVEKIISVRFEKEGMTSLTELLKLSPPPRKQAEIDPKNDEFCILYTSGSTGLPKGVMVTHQNVTQGSWTVATELKCSSEDVYLISIPLFNIFGLSSCLMAAIHKQSRMVFQDKYSPRGALSIIEEEKVTIRHAVPAMFIMELNIPEFSSFDLSSLRAGLIGGAPVHTETLIDIREKMKMDICPGYGLTEVGAISQAQCPDTESRILGTMGKVLPGIQVKIVNDEREPVPFGEVGEISCKGFGIIKGYYKQPELTKQTQDKDGWFYTGDLGTLDEEGYLRFVSRKKELIIRGGSNIYPSEIENILHQHPKVFEAAVIGIPDAVMGESVCAVIRLKDDRVASPEEIQEFLQGKLAKYKIPTQILFIEEFPVTGSGKIQKVKLKSEIYDRLHVSEYLRK